jgi:AbiTii
MSLLEDIIKAITETDEKTSSILRKCLVLSYKLKNDSLKSWVSKELNGYDYDDPDMPEYRKINAPAKGLFLGSFGRQINDQPIPSAVMKEEHRLWAERAKLTQPIAAYEEVNGGEDRVIPWPANLVAFYQAKFFDGEMALNRAWQEVPGSVMVGIVDTVRTRLLTFVLELKEQTVEEQIEVEKLPHSTVQTLVQMTVIGGTNVFGNVEQFAATTVQVGDAESLKGTLAALGIAHEQLAALEADIAADQAEEPKALGKRTLDWIGRNARTAGKGAVKIGGDVATAVMTEAVKRYMGL